MWLAFVKRREPDAAGDISHFQALMTALAATVGTGNIAGVATAIASGGPGALFWMWLTGLVGMATKFSEAVLAVKYRETDERGDMIGGPMFYLSVACVIGAWASSSVSPSPRELWCPAAVVGHRDGCAHGPRDPWGHPLHWTGCGGTGARDDLLLHGGRPRGPADQLAGSSRHRELRAEARLYTGGASGRVPRRHDSPGRPVRGLRAGCSPASPVSVPRLSPPPLLRPSTP